VRGETASAHLLLWAAVLLSACAREAAPPPNLVLRRVEPLGDRLFLNQSIEILFDRAVDPASVTEDTVQVLDASGLPVGGRLECRGHVVEFRPRPPVDPELLTGSFKPGGLYRLRLPGFPRSNTLRGTDGSFLARTRVREWRAWTEEDLAEGIPSVLLPASRRVAFYLEPQVLVDRDEEGVRILLRCSRPLYPPSVRPSVFRLLPAGAGGLAVPLREASILGREGHGGFGSEILLRPAWDPPPGHYRLLLETGSRGLLDDRLESLRIPARTRGGVSLPEPSPEGAWIDIWVPPFPEPSGWREDFGEPRQALSEDPEALGLGLPIEGALEWNRGLRMPSIPFEEEGSPPSLRVRGTLVLKPGEKDPRASGKEGSGILPASGFRVLRRWKIEKGARCILVLSPSVDTLRIRVLGAFELEGDLLVRFEGPGSPFVPLRRKKRGGVWIGDPRPTWGFWKPRVEIEVLGICRLDGRIGREMKGGPERIPGFLAGRGPFFGGKGSGLELWRWPLHRERRARHVSDVGGSSPGSLLPGLWAAVGPWRAFRRPGSGGLRLRTDPPVLPEGCRLFWQGRKPGLGGEKTPWVTADRLPELGLVEELRLAIVQDGRLLPPGALVLRSVLLH